MTIAEMHISFRQFAQQMGMQNVRAILPEQIDILLNQSIMDTVNQLIRENIGITNDRVITDNSKIGQINAFRTLYDVREITINIGNSGNFTYNPSNRLQGLIKHINSSNTEDNVLGNYMFLVDMSIKYQAEHSNLGSFNTTWYPVRIIDSAYLADTLNDFVLKNRFRSPIACIYNKNTIELYIDKFGSSVKPTVSLPDGLTLNPSALRIDVIKYPNVVRFLDDVGGTSVNCDLPESMHGDIVKHAVDLYRVAVNGSLQSSQEAEQAQQRENVRNNYRNEGNQ